MKHFSLERLVSASPRAIGVTWAVACLAGCGGTAMDDGTDSPQQARAMPTMIAPLLDDEGQPYPAQSAAVPADPGAETRAGLYATATQARQLEQALGNQVITLDVAAEGDGATAVDQATFMAFGLQAVHDLSSSAPILVRGRDLRLAAAAVNRLQAAGYSRVFLVNE